MDAVQLPAGTDFSGYYDLYDDSTGRRQPHILDPVHVYIGASKDDAAAVHPSLDVPAQHMGHGRWWWKFDANLLDKVLLDSIFADPLNPQTPVLLVEHPGGGRWWYPLFYEPATMARLAR